MRRCAGSNDGLAGTCASRRTRHSEIMKAEDIPPDPYVTIIFSGRNDNFGGDFNDRFFRALRFNQEKLIAANVSFDFVFVEWRPLDERPYLATVLVEEGVVPPHRITSFVVDRKYHDAVSLNPRLQ